MGSSITACVVEYLSHDTPLGKIFKVNIEDIVLEAGLYGKLWDMNVNIIQKYVSTHSWMFHTILYNYKCNITISSPHSELHPQREGYRAIMELAVEFHSKAATLKSINRVRMAFGVVHLSDITMSNGKGLDQSFIKNKDYRPYRNRHSWPNKHHVKGTDFTVWKRFLKCIYKLNNLRLYQSLRTWHIVEDWYNNWDWYTTTTGAFLYQHINRGVWHRHFKKIHTHHSLKTAFILCY